MVKFSDLPTEILEASLVECDTIRRNVRTLMGLKTEGDTKDFIIEIMKTRMEDGFPPFDFDRSDKIYGITNTERFRFWTDVFKYGLFNKFYEKFPKSEEVTIDNVKYVI